MNLLALHFSPDVEAVDQLLEDGSEGSDSNTTSNQHSDLVAEPVLVTPSEWTINEDLGVGLAWR